MSVILAKEKYKLALFALVAPGDIHSRVSTALGNYIFHLDSLNDLPDNARQLHLKLYQDIGVEATEVPHVAEKVNAMSELEVEKIAQHIVNTYEALV